MGAFHCAPERCFPCAAGENYTPVYGRTDPYRYSEVINWGDNLSGRKPE